ncbi:TetR/AcrR family transcriptional regulator [Oceanobacillus jordanicus]|uniref:TetR/AcrR family transcriptional regulator n=1 Tax=Oceanobacillus jordanicus TaxID=2867266 RepID=A0AAW5B997_9BACI|nr:TetR/AcrR family transcriptional regulator [Oceanobacillus jordanicus]MCG3419967.1 TetR/AcrR family transcriptional regulator [Oceanobacillus jordanicus]
MNSRDYIETDERKKQIINSAISVLTEIGYVKTTLSKIAQNINISTGLISYHFSGKEDLMQNTLRYLVLEERAFIQERVEKEKSNMNKLITYIKASLAYQAAYRDNNIALLEIVFNARTPENIPYYLVDIDEKDALDDLLDEILRNGVSAKEFVDIDPKVIAVIVRGAVSGSILKTNDELNLEAYTEKVIKSVKRMVN